MSDATQHSRALRRRLGMWIAAAILLGGGTFVWLWLLRGERILDNDAVLIGGCVVLGALVLLITALLHTTPPDALRLPRRTSAAIILTVATLMQAAGVVLLWPALSEDVLRYRLDGGMWLRGVSPYRVPPRDFAGDAIDRLAPFPQLHTIYPPVSQALFVAGRWVEERVGGDEPRLPRPSPAASLSPSQKYPSSVLAPPPAAPWRHALAHLSPLHHVLVFRVLFALAAVASTALLLAILQHAGRSAWWAVLFAWHPLLVLETGGMGHQDVVGCMFLLGMIYMLQRGKPAAAGVLLALAAGIKPQAGILAPLLLSVGGRGGVRAAASFVVSCLLLYLPLLIGGLDGWFATMRIYARTWEFNGSVYELSKHLFDHGGGGLIERVKTIARLIAVSGPLLVMLLMLRRRTGMAEGAYWIFLTMLLLSPVVYPWYLLWMLCMVPLLRGPAGWAGLVWGATVGISYVVWHQPAWVVPRASALAQYAPVYLVLATTLAVALKCHCRGGTSAPAAKT